MSRIWSMMDIGRRSMSNSQTALQTTAHNIANRSTEGFSRQRVETVSNQTLTGAGSLQIGSGARAGSVIRTNNPFIEKQIEREGGQAGYLNSRSELLARVEEVYNEQVNEGLNHSVGAFFNTFRELSNNPESLATRTQLKETAENLTKDFHRVIRDIQDVQKDADFRIATKVEEINQITKEISSLNLDIARIELHGSTANDERDRRDLLLKQLSEKVNIRYAEGETGMLTITAGNTAVLVSGTSRRELTTGTGYGKEGPGSGNLEIMYQSTDGGTPVNVSGQMVGGELGGILSVRDDICQNLQNSMDEMAYKLSWEVNRAHVQGYDRQGRTGNLFFNMTDDKTNYASRISLSDAIIGDVGRISAAAQKDAPADNTVANIISNIQYKGIFDGGKTTIDDFYNALVGKVGIETQRSNSEATVQRDVLAQLKNTRESISGVSLDEETTKMIEFQKAFDASARLIRTADEMLDTVLNIKRY